WRAVAANLLRNALREPGVIAALTTAARDPSELVRSMTVRSLGGVVDPSEPASAWNLKPLLDDPARAVRIDTAWALRRTVDTSGDAGSELLHYLTLNRDQPIGLMQWADFLTERGKPADALAALRQAVEWDKGSPP